MDPRPANVSHTIVICVTLSYPNATDPQNLNRIDKSRTGKTPTENYHRDSRTQVARDFRARAEPMSRRAASVSRCWPGSRFDHGEGATLTDADGNVYVDFFAGVAVASLGHGHPATGAGARATSLAPDGRHLRQRPSARKAFKLLSEIAPGNLKRAHLYSGGAEAVEAALTACALEDQETRGGELLGRLSRQDRRRDRTYRRRIEAGLRSAARRTLPGAIRRLLSMPLQAEYPELRDRCVDFARQQIKHSSAGALAAVLVEPMQGTAGNVIPPDDWMHAIKSNRAKEKARCWSRMK